MKKTLTTSLLLAASILSFYSCQEYSPFSLEEMTKAEYSMNFTKEYGQFPADMDWDLSNRPRTSKIDHSVFDMGADTRTVPGATPTDASEIATYKSTSNENDYYYVEAATLSWLRANLGEGNNNTAVGNPFRLSLDESTKRFAILPIYQGNAQMDWDLHIVNNGKDYNVWTKNQGIELLDTDIANDVYQQIGTPETGKVNSIDSRYNVRSKPIIISGLSGEFFLYLDITVGDPTQYAEKGAAQRSDEGMMLALECPVPENLKAPVQGAEETDEAFKAREDVYKNIKATLGVTATETINKVMIIGCEDANLWNSDWDINDVVFLVIGLPDLPNIIDYTGKRYMIEDLGNTYDFDFNDIVVDVAQLQTKQAVSTTGNAVTWETVPGSTKQQAVLKHLCGTLPFKVGFSNTVSVTGCEYNETIHGRINADPDLVIADSKTLGRNFWDPDENNIYVRVSQKDSDKDSEAVYTIAFPEKKENDTEKAPMIIAVDPTTQWMAESVHIPSDWWQLGHFTNKPSDIIWGDNMLDSNTSVALNASGSKVSVSSGSFTKPNDKVVIRFTEKLNSYAEGQVNIQTTEYEFEPGDYDFKIKLKSSVYFTSISMKTLHDNQEEWYKGLLVAGKEAWLIKKIHFAEKEKLKFDLYLSVSDGAGDVEISDMFMQKHVNQK